MRPRAITACSLLLLSVGACVEEPDPPLVAGQAALRTPRDVDCAAPDEPFDRRVCGLLGSLREANDLPGVSAALVLPDNETRTYAIGWADRELQVPMTPDTRMLAGSIGKTFVSALALALATDSVVDLDAPISRWVGGEDWFQRIPYGQEFTLRMLMTHMSGIQAHFDERFAAEVFPRFTDRDYDFEPTDLLLTLPEAGPGREPNQEMEYTDTAFDVAALTLAKAADEPYFQQIQRRFLGPLGLADTEPQDGWAFAGLAQGYFPRAFIAGQPEWVVAMFESVLYFDGDIGRIHRDGVLRMNPVSEFGGGGFISTPTDLATWARAFYGGSLLPGPYLENLTREAQPDPFPTEDPGNRILAQNYGLGTWITDTPFGRAFGHGGYFPGYLSGVAFFEGPNLAAAIQTNQVVGDLDLSLTLLDMVEAFVEGS